MSFVFKTIEPGNITVTPFYVNKLWSVGSVSTNLAGDSDAFVDSNISMSGYYGKFATSSWVMSSSEDLTRHGEYVRNIWNSIHSLYYRGYQQSPFDYYSQGNIGSSARNLTKHIKVLSIPEKIIGKGIKPGTFKIVDGTSTLIDDANGNLIMSNTTFGLDNSIYNESLKDFYYASFFYYDAVYMSKYISAVDNNRVTFDIASHGNLGATATYNLDSASGICAPVHSPRYLKGTVNNCKLEHTTIAGPYSLDMFPYTFTQSSYIRVPHSNLLNFNSGQDFSVTIWVSSSIPSSGATVSTPGKASGSRFLIGKRGLKKIRTAPWDNSTGKLDPNNTSLYSIDSGGDYITDVPELAQWPYMVEMIDAGYANYGKIRFSRSDGVNIDSVVSAGQLNAGWNLVSCRKSGSSMIVSINNTHTSASANTCVSNTTNYSDLFVGCRGDLITSGTIPNGSNIPSDGTTQYYGSVASFNIFNRAISDNDIAQLYKGAASDENFGPYNNYVGNIFYNQGIVVLNAPQSFRVTSPLGSLSTIEFDSLQFRSTKLITTMEAICVSGPGELNMTTNPSILVKNLDLCAQNGITEYGNYNSDGECKPFVTGSDFSPYITSVGLYNDVGDLLVIGKLATPIKKAQNCDTIFVVKWDM